MDTPPSDDEIRRKFDAIATALQTPRPALRKPPLPRPMHLRVRIDLDGAEPPIWRRLQLRSDLTLDAIHEIIQASFGWTDSHLHRFALGGNPFDRAREVFLCPHDVVSSGEDGAPTYKVQIDETMHEPGDTLSYVYDYDDCWAHTLILEAVQPLPADAPRAQCIDGGRAAPPENSGGITDAERLAEMLDDPAHFDVDEVNAALADPLTILAATGLHPRLLSVLHRLLRRRTSGELAQRVRRLADGPPRVSAEDLTAAVRPFTWFLQRAGDDGLALTSAGDLTPDDVVAASEVVPTMRDWIGTENPEVESAPLLTFRESLRPLGLFRKYKGTLRRTRAATAVMDDPVALAGFLAQRMVPDSEENFDLDGRLMLLFSAITSPDRRVPMDLVATFLTELGWRQRTGAPVPYQTVYAVGDNLFDTLLVLSDSSRDEALLSPATIAIAYSALTLRPLG